MKNKLPVISFYATIITLFIGILVIIGWFVHDDFLRAIIPGQVKMKFNVALGFVFSSTILSLGYLPVKNIVRHRISVVLSVIISLIGLLTLIEYIFSCNLGIDELFARDELRTTATYYAGRMSPLAAINFLLIGTGLLLLNKEKTASYQFFYLAGIAFVSFLMLIGFNFISEIPTYIRLAIHVAIGFIMLAIAIWFAQPALKKKISFERKLITGFTAVIILIVSISLLSFYYSTKRNRTAQLVEHTSNVLNETEQTLSITKDLESGSRGYVITGDSAYLDSFTAARIIISNHIAKLKQLTQGSHAQQERIDSLSVIVEKRIAFSLQSVVLRNEKGFEAAGELIATRQGKLYMDKIRNLIYQITGEEKETLVRRQMENKKSIISFNRAFIIFLVSVFLLLGIILFSIRYNVATRKKNEATLIKLNNELEQRVKERTGEVLKNERRFRALIENNYDIISLMDKSFRVFYRSPSASRITGWTDEEMENMDGTKNIHPDDLENAKGIIRELMTKPGQPVTTLFRNQHKNGSYRWLEGSVTNLLHDESVKAIVFNFRDVTERIEAEERVAQNEKRFRALVENNEGIISLIDDKLNVLFRSSSAARITGWTNDEFEKTNATEHIHPDDLEGLKLAMAKAMKNPDENIPIEIRVKHKNGDYIWLEGMIKNMIHNPAVGGIITNMQDITDKKEAEQKIIKANRLYFFISQINQMIVRTTDEETLFKEACRIAVDLGKFRMAWIGMVDEETKKVIPVMHAGEERDYLSRIKIISMADVPERRGPTGTALREGKYIICNDIETDMQMAPWKDAALGRGYLSSMALPIKKFGKVVGAFTFYASEKNFFDAREIALLEEATGDVAFALEIFEKEKRRKQAEAEAVNIYKEKETTLNRINDGMVSVDKDWRYTFMNDAAMATHPLGREETLGKIIWEIHPEMRGTIFWDKYHEAMETGRVVEVESFYAPMKTWFSVKVYPSHDGLTIFYSDVTERNNAASELKKFNERFEMIARTTNDSLWEWNFETGELWANQMHQHLYGLTPADPVPTEEQWAEKIHPDDRERIIAAQREALSSDKNVWMSEYRFQTKNKDYLDIYDRCYVVRNTEGKPIRIMGTMMDITERKKAETEIIKERNLSDSIINSMPGIFYLYNREGKFLRWNKNFEKVSKYEEAEIMQMHPLDFFDMQDKKLVAQKIENTFNLGEDNVQTDFLLKTKEKIPYYFTGKAIAYEGSICLLGVGIDFSERIKAQERIKETTIKLRQLTAHLQNIREEERKRIGREIHDELGQQLTAIKMDISWIDKKMPKETGLIKSKIKNIIGLLDGSNQSIRRILSELRPGMLDERGLIEAIEWLGRQFTGNTGIPLEFTCTETEIKLAEPLATCIFRVYQEALTNVMRYAGASKVWTSFSIVNDTILVTIVDDGQGFDPVAIQSRQSFGILGMKERVASVNGEFKMDSSVGKGTKITISIPC